MYQVHHKSKVIHGDNGVLFLPPLSGRSKFDLDLDFLFPFRLAPKNNACRRRVMRTWAIICWRERGGCGQNYSPYQDYCGPENVCMQIVFSYQLTGWARQNNKARADRNFFLHLSSIFWKFMMELVTITMYHWKCVRFFLNRVGDSMESADATSFKHATDGLDAIPVLHRDSLSIY